MELKPCPFCGWKAKVSFKDYLFGGWNGLSESRRKYREQVICNRCRARGKPIAVRAVQDRASWLLRWMQMEVRSAYEI